MSNRPKIKGSKKVRNPRKIEKIKAPCRMRIYHHIGDMAGCGTIRVIFPAMILNNYFSHDYQFESIYNNRFSPHQGAYNDCSFITFQRSATKEQLHMIRHFKKMNPGKALIYEIDDLLMGIPEWNFASSFYDDNKSWIEKILSEVHGIVCSTPLLKKQLYKYNQNINVSPNHLPKFIWGEARAKVIEETIHYRQPRIMYAGSHNHFDQKSDRGDFGPEMIDFVKKTLDKYQWIFVGGIPQSLKGNDRIIQHEWRPVIEYPSFLKMMNPDIFLAPLDNNLFNRCKSNIKALEAAALGIPLVGSDLEPYQGLDMVAKTDEEMISNIETLADDPDMRTITWERQHFRLKDQLFWEDNNHTNMFDYLNQHLRLHGREL